MRTGTQKMWCRMNEGVSRCVDAPFDKSELPKDIKAKLGNRDWCPFRVCGPSYTSTEMCPTVEELKPEGLCSVKTVHARVHSCVKGKKPDSLPEEVACKLLGGRYCGLGDIYICRCSSDMVSQTLFELKTHEKPPCPSNP